MNEIEKVTLFTDQMWKLEGTTLKDQGNLWVSDGKWQISDQPGGHVCVMNMISTTVIKTVNNQNISEKINAWTALGIVSNDKVKEEKDCNKESQYWEKKAKNGYFTLINQPSQKVLTAISKTELGIRGKSGLH